MKTPQPSRRDFLKAVTAFTAIAAYPPLEQLPLIQYVDTAYGDDSNNGVSQQTAKATLAAALTALTTDNVVRGRIVISASSDKPALGFVDFNAGEITLEGVGGLPWYAERTTTFPALGWVDEGDNIFSRDDGTATADILFVTSQIDNSGFSRMLTPNLSTPTTPAPGEFGHTDGKFYVHLIGDRNPNEHTIKRHNTPYLFRASGKSKITIKDCVGRYVGGNGVFECGDPDATLILENCVGQYSASAGVSIPINGGAVYCTNCTMQRHTKDGYTQHGGVLTLIDCDGSYNSEGASSYDGANLTISGGRYHHNRAGGCIVTGSGSEMVLTNVLVDFNGTKDAEGIEFNGIVFDTDTSGSVINCKSQNNIGSGFYCNGASVEITKLTSGIKEGNTLPDVTCS